MQSTVSRVDFPDIWTTIQRAGLSFNDHEFALNLPEAVTPPPAPLKETYRKKGQRTVLSLEQKKILTDWLFSHGNKPYPTVTEKEILMAATGLKREQISVWFTNNRIRQRRTGRIYGRIAATRSVEDVKNNNWEES